MDQQEIVQWCLQHLPSSVLLVLMALGSLVVLGLVVVPLTPSKSDDEFLAKLQAKPIVGHLLKFLVAFSPIAKKEGHVVLNKVEMKPEEAPKA